MSEVDLITMSSRGQISIPSEMRKKMDLTKGSKLLVYQKNNELYLRKIDPEALEKSFSEILEPIQERSKEKGLSPKDAEDLVRETRKQKQ
ncbi:MAG: AbrB family transcriptional regulator [Candidatus Methanohalarchaeum thermophilum]|uniref:AbrB family transcriptional regulator n=1 Tax=Methanohalarchaeum thermophilum TaxID=1903181 RepID=A0A1Q6DU98_METT1|nr:MAG: AbrB family transcriptional regulator [Candidatus Methanohalarchaeum thermophilum]